MPAAAWLALIAIAGFAFTYWWASRYGNFEPDENQNVYLARWVAHNLPGGLWNFSVLQRGVQRLEIFVLALGLGTMRSPQAFFLAHALNAAAFASACFPAFRLARGLGASARWALLAALLVVATPWVLYAVTFLTEPLAYPAFVWATWGIWRAVADPRPATQLAAFALIGIAALSRSMFVLLAAVPPVAAVLQELRFGGARGLPRALWSRHRVMTIAVVGALVVFAASSVGVLADWRRLAGYYGTPFGIQWSYFAPKTALYASRAVTGVGFVPFAIGLAWLLRELVRPRRPAGHAYAAVAALSILVVVYASASAGKDERYAIYFGPLLIVAAVVALARREVGPLPVAAAGVLGAVLLWRQPWNLSGGPYGYFIGPSESFYGQVYLARLGYHLGHGVSTALASFVVALGLAAACAYAMSRRRAAPRVAAALVGALVVVQLMQTQYSTRHFVNTVGESYGPSLSQRAWVDDRIYGKSTAAAVGLAQTNTPPFGITWGEVFFWNTSVQSIFTTVPVTFELPVGVLPAQLTPDETTGRIATSSPLPPYAVVSTGYTDYGLAATPVARPVYMPLEMVRPSRPLQARFHAFGPGPDGRTGVGVDGRVRFFARGLPPGATCASVPLTAPRSDDGRRQPLRWTVGGEHGVIADGGRAVARARLAPAGRPYLDLPLRLERDVRVGGRPVSGDVGRISVDRC